MSKTYEDRIAAPWTIKIEQSYGCNLSCSFCPIDNLKFINENKNFLSPSLCSKIAEQACEIKENLRVELTLRGEPTLNPRLSANLKLIRNRAPKFQISLFTNGLKLLKDPTMVGRLLDAGVNILCIDCYNNTYDRFKELVSSTGEEMVDFRKFTAYKRYSNGHKLRIVNLVPDIQEGDVNVRKIHNNAGNVNPEYLSSLEGYWDPKLPLSKKCARPFRELVVYHDGNVVICCHDWKAENIIGNIKDSTLYEIWYGKKHLDVLKKLYSADRNMSPCSGCDYKGGYRIGFLHDPKTLRKKPSTK